MSISLKRKTIFQKEKRHNFVFRNAFLRVPWILLAYMHAISVAPTRSPHNHYLHRTKPTSITLAGENLSSLQSFREFKFPARMLIGNFDKSLVCCKAVAPLFKNSHIGSCFACITKAYCYQC